MTSTITNTSANDFIHDGNGCAIVAKFIWVTADGAIRSRKLRADQTAPATFAERLRRENAIAAWVERPNAERAACIIAPRCRELRLRRVRNAPRGYRFAA